MNNKQKEVNDKRYTRSRYFHKQTQNCAAKCLPLILPLGQSIAVTLPFSPKIENNISETIAAIQSWIRANSNCLDQEYLALSQLLNVINAVRENIQFGITQQNK